MICAELSSIVVGEETVDCEACDTIPGVKFDTTPGVKVGTDAAEACEVSPGTKLDTEATLPGALIPEFGALVCTTVVGTDAD